MLYIFIFNLHKIKKPEPTVLGQEIALNLNSVKHFYMDWTSYMNMSGEYVLGFSHWTYPSLKAFMGIQT